MYLTNCFNKYFRCSASWRIDILYCRILSVYLVKFYTTILFYFSFIYFLCTAFRVLLFQLCLVTDIGSAVIIGNPNLTVFQYWLNHATLSGATFSVQPFIYTFYFILLFVHVESHRNHVEWKCLQTLLVRHQLQLNDRILNWKI